MATYKVIQDIEAEDHLVGPFSFRQFVYILLAAFFGYLCFIAVSKGAPFFLALFAPPMLFCLFFAWPWSSEQSTEAWALARIRFLLKPRKRIWDQAGIKEFVTITVPKRIEKAYTDGLTQAEVRSRLKALADTIDSRGWAIKNAYSPGAMAADSDRLLGFEAAPMEVPDVAITASDDILDEHNNPTASKFTQLIDQSTREHRQSLMQMMQQQSATVAQQSRAQASNWFMKPSTGRPQQLPQPVAVTPVTPLAPAVSEPLVQTAPAPTPDPAIPVAPPTPTPVAEPVEPAVPSQPEPAIIHLSKDNNLNVVTLAKEAKKAREDLDGEVVISLR